MGRLPRPSLPTPAPMAPLLTSATCAAGAEAADLVGERLDAGAVERAARVGEHVGADLDHHRGRDVED